MNEERMSYENSWHLDKKVSIGIIAAICLQCACFVWYGAQLDSEVKQDHNNIQSITAWREKQDDERSKIDAHLAVVDEKLSEQNGNLRHIIEILEKPSRGR